MQHHPLRLAAALALLVAAPAAAYEVSDGAVKPAQPILFKAGSAELAPESDAGLADIATYLADKSYITLLRVEVHSDAGGDAAKLQALTEARALAVARALVARGVDCKRVLPVGFGADKPVAPNDTPEGRAANRRVTFVNATLRGKAIGGMPVDGGGRVAGDPCP